MGLRAEQRRHSRMEVPIQIDLPRLARPPALHVPLPEAGVGLFNRRRLAGVSFTFSLEARSSSLSSRS